MLNGLLPSDESTEDELTRKLLEGRICEIRMLYFVGKDLLRWIAGAGAPPREVFVTHGEAAIADGYAETVRQERKWNVSVPAWGESHTLVK